jgi:diguanylate cyclase (GGDEF)-like protein
MRVCIVDGNASHAAALHAQLSDQGYQSVSIVASVRTLLEHARQRQLPIEELADLVLVVATDTDGGLSDDCRSLSHATATGGTAVVVVARCDRDSYPRLVEFCLTAGAIDVIPVSESANGFSRRIGLVLNLQRERRFRRLREEALETELAERKVMEARLKHLVDHDDLTGLPNRRRLEQALELAVIRSRNFHRTNALLYLDLDQFKVINDSEGHVAGDRLLTDVANKLRGCVKPGELVARIGSDEFAILLEHITEAYALEFAESVRSLLGDYQFGASGGLRYHVGVSVGVVVNVPDEEIGASELLARADQACYMAKNQGRNTVHRFSAEDQMMHNLRSDALWVPQIREALADDKFFLVFQPVMHLPTRRVTHYEALIRMYGDNGEVLTPAEFIPVAERMGLIHQIDLWVVEHILDYLASLPSHLSHISMSVNLSGHAFQDSSLLPLIKQKLDMTWVSASRLTFEITETAAITNFAETRKMVARLRALGCRFALDDFGAGFSSFSYIKNFPVDMLKIDGSFVANLMNDQTDQLLVKSMTEVAHSLGKKVIAEYVEHAELMEQLAGFGVDYVQGYYIGHPQQTLIDADWRAPRSAGVESSSAGSTTGQAEGRAVREAKLQN